MATKDYLAIARDRITKPSTADRPPRLFVYGRYKKGKTRFCTTAGNILIIDPEHGTDQEKRTNPDVWHISSWDDIHEVYQFLRLGKHQYQWVAVDGLTRITNMALRWVMNREEERNLERKPDQVGKQDYGKSGEMVKAMLHNFDSLRSIGLIVTAGERMREVEASEEDEDATNASVVFVPDLPNGVRASVNSIVDVIGRIYTIRGDYKKRVKVKATGEIRTVEYHVQRRLWIGHHPTYDTGARSDFDLPDFIIEPTVTKLLTVMREGVTTK